MKEPKLIKIIYCYDDGIEKISEGRDLKKYDRIMMIVSVLRYDHKRSWHIPDWPEPKKIKK